MNSDPKSTKKAKTTTKKLVSVKKASGMGITSTDLVLPVVTLRDGVLFPHTESVLTFGRESTIDALKQSKYTRDRVVLVTQKDPNLDEPTAEDVYLTGTLAVVERTLNADGQINALVRGVGRVKIITFTRITPSMTAKIQLLSDQITPDDDETRAMVKHLHKTFRKVVNMGKPVEFLNFMKLMSGSNHGELVDQIASTLTLDTQEKQEILEMLNVKERLQVVVNHLTHELKVLEIEKDVASKTQEKFEKNMRESVLRERMKTIQKELGDIEDEEEIMESYEQKLKKLRLDKKLKDQINKEIKRLRQMSPNNPEAGYVRSWLDTVFEMPWNDYSKENISISKADKILNKNHYGLEKVKDRIIEYIAVMQLKRQQEKLEHQALPTILCFVGPPGVGKTSIGRSVAEALGRKFVKISLGGIRDEAEIRGHRRTYVGAMPGRIISGIKQAGTSNPVFMLDEIDKLGHDFRGDPSAALLEALDPEQNKAFEDHYLDLPYDLSDVIFITTANTLDTIPNALRDRLEIIRYPGYTQDEKFHIAKKHLLSKVQSNNGLEKGQVKLSASQIRYLIGRYTREAGVRSLERTLNTIMRKAARRLLEKNSQQVGITNKLIKEYLGPEKYDVTLTEDKDTIGLAAGLAWTEVGGDVLFVEVALSNGKGQIKLTGKLGDVMKESAQAALTYVRSNAEQLGIDPEKISKTDVHIHVPEGAVPKDGPSAGITITTAIVSAFTGKRVRREIAMTGEVTLRGRVLRIGGLKEKSIAAHRAGCKTVIIPKDNERDLVEIPNSVKKDLKFTPVANVAEVLKIALV